MKLIFYLSILMCFAAANGAEIPTNQTQEMMPGAFSLIQAESYSYTTTGSLKYNDCGNITVGNLHNNGMLKFDNVDPGPLGATSITLRYSNKDVGTVTVNFYNVYPVAHAQLNLQEMRAVRTTGWCDFNSITYALDNTPPLTKGTYYLTFDCPTVPDDAVNCAGIDIDYFTIT